MYFAAAPLGALRLVVSNPHGLRHGLHHIATIVAKKSKPKYHWSGRLTGGFVIYRYEVT